MNRSLWICSLEIAAIAALTCSCGKTGNESTGAAKAQSAAPPIFTTKSGVEMVQVPGGEFLMGSVKGNPDETPLHKVHLNGFLIDRFEVTHELFAKAQLPNPSH